jgi:putative transposase
VLLVDVLRSYVKARKSQLHDFVVMPDHLHLLTTVHREMTIEKTMQFTKGGFSFRLSKEFGYLGEVWQRGFSEVRVCDRESFLRYRRYIAQNPVKAGLVDKGGKFPYCFTYLANQKAAGAKARQIKRPKTGMTEVMPRKVRPGPPHPALRAALSPKGGEGSGSFHASGCREAT